MPSLPFSLQESFLCAKLGTGTWAQVQSDLIEPTHPRHSHLAPFFPYSTDESRPAPGSHPGWSAVLRQRPLQVEASSGSSLQHEDEVKQLLLFLFPSGFPLPSRARDRKLTALHSRP